jgi:hypothetical protein
MFGLKEFDMRVLLLSLLLAMAGCAAPQNAGDVKAAESMPAKAIETKTIKNTPGEVDFSCKTSSDCKIKDVGSCCGYRPACVNKDSPTFAAEVKARCGKEGMAGICGFPSISSCACTNNKCEGVAGAMAEENLQ